MSMTQISQATQVAKSSCYYKMKHKDDKSLKDKEIYELIKHIFDVKCQKAGIRTIAMILRNKFGMTVNLKKIARIKREYGLITKIRRKNPYNIAFKKSLEHRTVANLLQQNFNIKQPDRVYSTDISYLIYRGGKRAYLSATKDLATKEIVDFNVSRSLDLSATYGRFYDFLKNKNCKRLIIHSDQGWHYTHPIYVNKLNELGVTQSMSRKGNCLDNAPIESFFGHLKDEVDLKSCQTFEEVKSLIENYIFYYNNERCQWNLNKMTPTERRCHLLNPR